MADKIIKFTARSKSKGERPYVYAIPLSKIDRLKTQAGSHNVYCQINGIETNCSFEDLLKLFDEVIELK